MDAEEPDRATAQQARAPGDEGGLLHRQLPQLPATGELARAWPGCGATLAQQPAQGVAFSVLARPSSLWMPEQSGRVAQGGQDMLQASVCHLVLPRDASEGFELEGLNGRSDRTCHEQQKVAEEGGGGEALEHETLPTPDALSSHRAAGRSQAEESALVQAKVTYQETKETHGEAKETCGEAEEGRRELAHGLTDVQVEEYREAFGLFDRDGGGTITAVEIGTVLRSIGLPPTP